MTALLQYIYRRWFKQHRHAAVLRKHFLAFYFRFLEREPKPVVAYELVYSPMNLAGSDLEVDSHSNVRLRDVMVIGFSRFALKDTRALYEEDFGSRAAAEVHTEYLYQEETHGLMVAVRRDEIRLPRFMRCPTLEGAWISTLTASSNNWMHWISETMPKLVRILNAEEDVKPGLLVDDNLPETHASLLDVLAPGLPRYPVPVHRPVRVEQLVTSRVPTGNSVFWPRRPHSGTGIYSFDPESLLLVRRKLLDCFGRPARKHRRIFVRRKSFFRHLSNEANIESLLKLQGFEAISPGEMSVAEQVGTFSEASVVVAQAGAALANIAFMSPGMQVICLAARSPFVNYDYFRDYAAIFNLDLNYILGDVENAERYDLNQTAKKDHPTNAEFSCPEQALCDLIEQISSKVDHK